MTVFGIKRLLARVSGSKPADPKPLFDGPPGRPEYFMLCAKPGARYADKAPSVYQLVDEADAQRLRKLRFDRYLQQFPDKRGQISEKIDVQRYHDADIDPDHVPKSCVFRQKVSFASNTFTDLSVIYGLFCPFVRPAFKAGVETVAPGLMQFFPYDCRLKTGEVFAQGYFMHWSKTSKDPIDAARSGLVQTGPLYRQERLQSGQVVVRRSMLDGSAVQVWGHPVDMIYTRRMAESLTDALGKNEQFYPVHVCDDVKPAQAGDGSAGPEGVGMMTNTCLETRRDGP